MPRAFQMYRSHLMATAAAAVLAFVTAPAFADDAIETITVTAARLDAARIGIQPQTGASTYTISDAAIQAQPGGDNNLLNQVVLQAPGVAQDSFGQLHVRGEHNGLQYRLNGIIIPEGISVFGPDARSALYRLAQADHRRAAAEYGDRTAGIIDVQTKTGVFQPGGDLSIYGGSHGEIEPSIDYGGSSGSFNYYVSGDYETNTLGIESPDGSSDPLHDRTKQWHGFAYLQDILDSNSSPHRDFRNLECCVPDSQPARPSAVRPRRHQRSWPDGRSFRQRTDPVFQQRPRRKPARDHALRHRQLPAFAGPVRFPGLGLRPLFEPFLHTRSGRRPALQRHRADRVQARCRLRPPGGRRISLGRRSHASLRRDLSGGRPDEQNLVRRSGGGWGRQPDAAGHAAHNSRQWHQARLELQPLSPGRVEDLSDPHPETTACAGISSAPSIPKTNSARA